MSDATDYGYGPCGTPGCAGEGMAVLSDGTAQCRECFNAYFSEYGNTDHSATDQPSPFTDEEASHHRAIRFALGDDGWRAYCHGKSLEFLLPRQPHPRRSMARDRASQFARWASGEEWRPGRGDSATPYTDVLARWNAEHDPMGEPKAPPAWECSAGE